MSEKLKPKTQNMIPADVNLTLNERILKECHSMYAQPNNGITTLGNNVGLGLLPPHKKTTIMVIGNHSAGKSSFINWYIEDNILKTGVAIESQGFTFVTSGKKREVLTGNATLHLFSDFQALRNIEGVMDYVSTEISTSKQKDFPLIDFIDTPGLVDGDKKYPYDVNRTLLCMSDMCDLILVFFDPMGQALCKRTLDIVEKIGEFHLEKIRIFLSKADEAGQECDRQRVMMQIVQELCKKSGLNKTGLNIPAIHIPNINNKEGHCLNQIDEACKQISKTVNQTVQMALDKLEKDSDDIYQQINIALRADDEAKTSNRTAKLKGMCLSLLGFLLPVFLVVQLMVASAPRQTLNSFLGADLASTLIMYMEPLTKWWKKLGSDNQMTALTTSLVLSGLCLILSRVIGKTNPTLQVSTKKVLTEGKTHIDHVVRPNKERLYSEYLQQSVSD